MATARPRARARVQYGAAAACQFAGLNEDACLTATAPLGPSFKAPPVALGLAAPPAVEGPEPMRGWRLAATQWPTCATRLRSDGVGELAAEHHARAGLRVLETVRGGRVGAGIR